jgi:nitrogen-specific signal transduction histidine kinase
MTYAEFKKEHDYLVTEIIFTENNRADTLVERLERLRLDNQKHFNQLWADL